MLLVSGLVWTALESYFGVLHTVDVAEIGSSFARAWWSCAIISCMSSQTICTSLVAHDHEHRRDHDNDMSIDDHKRGSRGNGCTISCRFALPSVLRTAVSPA